MTTAPRGGVRPHEKESIVAEIAVALDNPSRSAHIDVGEDIWIQGRPR